MFLLEKNNTFRFFYVFFIFVIIFILMVSRRPDILFNAQPWAEDGTIWMQNIHNDGFWSTIFLPQNGYFQTVSKLSYGVGLLFGVEHAALISNVIAISLRCFMVVFLLSSRLNAFRLYYRVLLAVYFIFMPNLAEGYVNITNAHWYLAMYLMLTLIATPPKSTFYSLHDYLILFISALSGPFVVFIAPCLIMKRIYERSGFYNAIKGINSYDVLFALLCLVQVAAILSTFSETRVATTLGASYQLLADIIVYRVFLGSFFDNIATMSMISNHSGNVIALSSFMILALVMFIKGSKEYRICIIFPVLMIAFALAKPMMSLTGEQWPLFLLPDAGGRYFYVTNIFLYIFLLHFVSRLGRYDKIILATITIAMLPLYYSYYKIPAMEEVGYRNGVIGYESLSVGESISIPINPPGWFLTLIKQ